eukprot:403368474
MEKSRFSGSQADEEDDDLFNTVNRQGNRSSGVDANTSNHRESADMSTNVISAGGNNLPNFEFEEDDEDNNNNLIGGTVGRDALLSQKDNDGDQEMDDQSYDPSTAGQELKPSMYHMIHHSPSRQQQHHSSQDQHTSSQLTKTQTSSHTSLNINQPPIVQERSGPGRPGRPSKRALAAKAGAAGSSQNPNQQAQNRNSHQFGFGNRDRDQNDGSYDDDQGSDYGGDADFTEFIFENNESGQKIDFKKFSDKERINSVFSAMDDIQKERFETFRQSNFDEKKMKKILSSILGTTGKMQKNISTIIKSVAKIYVGQLVEESKLIQIEELEIAGVDVVNQPVELHAIQPHQLTEARRRLLTRGELVSEKPKPMFKRR